MQFRLASGASRFEVDAEIANFPATPRFIARKVRRD